MAANTTKTSPNRNGKSSATPRHKPSGSRTQQKSSDNEYLLLSQRLKAEFDNYKKRTSIEMESKFNDGKAYAILKIIPVLDSIVQAKRVVTDENSARGIDMIYDNMEKILRDLGVEKIDCVGKEFDPNYHNAVMAEDSTDGRENIILEELQAGYILDGRVLRHSVVKVSR